MDHSKRFVELCPQCCKSVNSSTYRLVQDTCGHTKCRICLLQEVSGCLICEIGNKRLGLSNTIPKEATQQRKSVIQSVASHLAELATQRPDKQPSSGPMDKDTCMILKETMKEDILFPKHIAKTSSKNFYHLKRIISERFFNDEDQKQDKAAVVDNSTEQNQPPPPPPPPLAKIELSLTPKLFNCNICTKNFPTRNKLNKHRFIHNKNSKYQCSTCNKIFKDNYALTSHLRKHTNEKPFLCNICNKTFSEATNLKRHEKYYHIKEKKFACDVCQNSFTTCYDLKRHQAIHKDEKNFSCNVCDKKFTYKTYLVRHQLTHEAANAHVCYDCHCAFKRKDNLKRHIKCIHANQDSSNDTMEPSVENGHCSIIGKKIKNGVSEGNCSNV